MRPKSNRKRKIYAIRMRMHKGHNAERTTVALTCPIKYMKKSYNFINSPYNACWTRMDPGRLFAASKRRQPKATTATTNTDCDEEDHTNVQYLLRLHNKLSTVWCRRYATARSYITKYVRSAQCPLPSASIVNITTMHHLL